MGSIRKPVGDKLDQLTVATTYQEALGQPVPEPSSLALLASGLMIAPLRRKQRA